MRWPALFTALGVLIVVVGAYAQTSGKDATYYVRISLNDRYVTADSSDTVKFCPSGEDTTSNCTYCTFLGSDALRIWSFAPDSSDVYDGYANDTLITYMEDRFYLSTQASDGFIQDPEVFGDAVVPGSALAANAAWDNLAATGASSHMADATGAALSSSATAFKADTLIGNLNGSRLVLNGSAQMGASRSDTTTFSGPVHFDELRILSSTSTVCDSFPSGGDSYAYYVVDGVSELMAEGWTVKCRGWPDFTYWNMYSLVGGLSYKQGVYAAPVRQDPASPTDSVYVVIPVGISGEQYPFCIECFGVK